MIKPVGFDQKILLHHLDFVANETLRTSRKEMYEKLDNCLRCDIAGNKSRKNAITILMKIWYLVEDDFKKIQMDALTLYPKILPEERVVLHWGMTLIAFPFFKDLVFDLGNLFRFQEDVASQQITRKMKLLYGDRRRVEVATSAVLTSLKNWGVVIGTKNKYYRVSQKKEIDSKRLKEWMAEVILKLSDHGSLTIDIINSNPMFFPFEYFIRPSELSHEKFVTNQMGYDNVMVELK